MSRQIAKLPDDALPIHGARDHWVDRSGNIYAIDHRNQSKRNLIIKSQHSCWGYKYCGIRYDGNDSNTSRRVHRLVAEAFVPNPEHLPCVGHKNNIKSDNRVENLYWTTVSENTQKAFDDGLAKNDSGASDSQSMPCMMFDRYTNEMIGIYGSIKEAGRITGISFSTIARQCKYGRPVRKPFYFRYCTVDEYLFHKCESTIESEKASRVAV